MKYIIKNNKLVKSSLIFKSTLMIFLAIFFICSLSNVSAVDHSIDNTTTGGISNAMSSASSGDKIYLQEGTYKGTNNTGLTINKNLTFIGNGSKENIIIDAQKARIIFALSSGINITFINITFINGYSSTSYGGGGAIYNPYSNTLLTINNSKFENNTVSYNGGAIYNNGTASISNSIFINNTATGGSSFGGGIYNSGPNLSVINSDFINNNASRGGGILSNAFNMTIKNSRFINNTGLWGAGVQVSNGGNNSFIINTNFLNNGASYDGGGLRNDAFNLTVINSTFTNNRGISQSGGGIYNEGKNLTIINSTFTNNSANYNGGAILNSGTYGYGSNMTIINSIFSNNICNLNGGAIVNGGTNLNVINSIFNRNSANSGAAIYNSDETFIIANSTFEGNIAKYNGGGFYTNGGFTYGNHSIINSTFINNYATNGSGIYANQVNLTVSNSIFINNTASEKGGVIFNIGSQYMNHAVLFSNNIMNGNIAKLGNEIYNEGNIGNLNLIYLANSTIKVNNNTYMVLFASLTDDMGNLVTGQNISFYINGVFIGTTRVIEGYVNLTYKVTQGSGIFPVTGNYTGHSWGSINIANGEFLVVSETIIDSNINNDKNKYGVNETSKINITVVNKGPNKANNVIVKVNLPSKFVLNKNKILVSYGTYDPDTGIWYVGDLNSGEKATMTFVGKFSEVGTNMFSISADGNNFNSTFAEKSVLVRNIIPNPTPNGTNGNNGTNANNDTNNNKNADNSKKSNNNSIANAAVMKSTGMPIIAIILVLFMSLGLITRKR